MEEHQLSDFGRAEQYEIRHFIARLLTNVPL